MLWNMLLICHVCSIDAINILNQKYFDLSPKDEVNIILGNDLDANSLKILEEDHVADKNLQEAVFGLDSF